MKKTKLGTSKLNNGIAVAAREIGGQMYAYTFSNRTQAEAHAEKLGGEVRQFRSPVFSVRVNPDWTPGFDESAWIKNRGMYYRQGTRTLMVCESGSRAIYFHRDLEEARKAFHENAEMWNGHFDRLDFDI